MKFEDSFLYAKPVKEAFVEEFDRTVYWLNGTVGEHNGLMKLVASDKTRQEGWVKSVYALACDESGEYLFRGKVMQTDFMKNVDHAMARTYGALILGITTGDDGDSEFDAEVKEQVKNSEKAKPETNS